MSVFVSQGPAAIADPMPGKREPLESEPPMLSDELSRTFTALSPNGKATFLTRITFEQTIHARGAYLNYAYDPTDVDATALRRSNEYIHRLSGYTLQCLQGKTTAEQDASFVAMILDGGSSADALSRWLGDAKNAN